MKSFKQFCVVVNIQEFWNQFAPKPTAANPKK
jgi:hypothetical protein